MIKFFENIYAKITAKQQASINNKAKQFISPVEQQVTDEEPLSKIFDMSKESNRLNETKLSGMKAKFKLHRLTIHNDGILGGVVENCSDEPLYVVGLSYKQTIRYDDAYTTKKLVAGAKVKPGEKVRLSSIKLSSSIEKVGGFGLIYQESPGDWNDDGTPAAAGIIPVKGSFKREGFLQRFKYNPD